MGGSDQWGNIVNGVELGRRVDGRELFGLTTPLITTASGAKMGKTAQGAVWLNEDRLSSFDYRQYWRNVDDADVGRFLRLFTELPLDEIERLELLKGAELNEAKNILADQATKLCRGPEEAKAAAEAARAIHQSDELSLKDFANLEVTRTIEIPRLQFDQGLTVVELLQRSGLVSSKGDARRLIRGRGARINDERVEDEMLVVTTDHLTDGQLMLSAGKKRHALVRVV
jgi:tyrosyl-tRNA synthetase